MTILDPTDGPSFGLESSPVGGAPPWSPALVLALAALLMGGARQGEPAVADPFGATRRPGGAPRRPGLAG